jgi:hypothetical protein
MKERTNCVPGAEEPVKLLKWWRKIVRKENCVVLKKVSSEVQQLREQGVLGRRSECKVCTYT